MFKDLNTKNKTPPSSEQPPEPKPEQSTDSTLITNIRAAMLLVAIGNGLIAAYGFVTDGRYAISLFIVAVVMLGAVVMLDIYRKNKS